MEKYYHASLKKARNNICQKRGALPCNKKSYRRLFALGSEKIVLKLFFGCFFRNGFVEVARVLLVEENADTHDHCEYDEVEEDR